MPSGLERRKSKRKIESKAKRFRNRGNQSEEDINQRGKKGLQLSFGGCVQELCGGGGILVRTIDQKKVCLLAKDIRRKRSCKQKAAQKK